MPHEIELRRLLSVQQRWALAISPRSTSPGRPLVRRRHRRHWAEVGSFSQNYHHVDNKKTTVVHALNIVVAAVGCHMR
jgi:hypothetical protein